MKTLSANLPNITSIRNKPAGQRLLERDATLWLDARFSVPGEQIAVNRGTGGSALNARYGSTTGVDTNDPELLLHNGENYIYLPGIGVNNLTVPDAPALDPVNDLTIVARVRLTDWTPAIRSCIVAKHSVPGT